MSEALLRISVREKRFRGASRDDVVLRGVEIVVAPGEIVSIYGRSGCGKSSLLRIAAGLDRAFEGEVCLRNRQITGPTREIGYVAQSETAFEWLSVRQNIEWPTRGSESPSSARNRATELAALVGLPEGALEKYPHQISGGMKQRLVLARSLAARPSVLMLDEPLSALDYEARVSIQDVVRDLRDASGVAFVCVTHDPEEALYLADRVLVLGGAPAGIVATVDARSILKGAVHRASPQFIAHVARLRALLREQPELA